MRKINLTLALITSFQWEPKRISVPARIGGRRFSSETELSSS